MSKIILVDDDEDMIAICERWLIKAGYEVTACLSGQEAVDVLKAEGADLVLLDYAMPGMSGPDTLRAIREDEKLKDIPVFIRTGMEDNEIADAVSDLHPQRILPKSEGKPALLGAIAEVLG